MNTTTTLSKGSWIQLNECRAARTGLLLLLLLLTLPAAVGGQFTYLTNKGTIAITQFAASHYFSLLTVQVGGMSNGRHSHHYL